MTRRFLYKILLIVLPIGLLVVLSNYYIDPANLFSSEKYVAGIADILSRGHNVDNVANYDERLLQAQMIRKAGYRPDVVVLGSSRIMEIGSDFFPGKKVLNCGVSHANINDLLAIMGALDSAGKLPGEIVINVDPFLICKGGTSEWESLAGYHRYFMGKLGLASEEEHSNVRKKLYSLVSFEYFEKSLSFLAHGKTKKYVDVGLQNPANYGRLSDGAIAYPSSYTAPDTIKVAGDAKIVGAREQADFDSAKLSLLNGMLDYLNHQKIKVMFVMLPFHDQYYSAMNQNHPNTFFTYENSYHEIARKRQIEIRGGFDPIRMGIPENQFYDAHHCSKAAIKKTLSNQIL